MNALSSRPDGRRPDELRPVRFFLDYVDYPEGSVLVEWGRTRVLCNLTLQEGVPRWLAGSGQGWLTAEYALLPRSTHTRTPRENGLTGGRTQEIRRFIGRSLRASLDLARLGERTLILDCDVLQADGGTRTAAVTGGYVALALALRRLAARGVVPPDLIRMPVAAVSVGIVRGEVRLDLCYEEDSQAEVDLNVVMTGDGRFVEVQGTAEKSPFSRYRLDQMLSLARRGIDALIAAQEEALR
ncbi:MAG: ribonuclease PH [Anaerolineae bacterium]|nr:ribonuclease PH [Anaerolineae bacterium]MDW8068692.1 ribonuclease PH [Anaerolineae bacterium]